MKLLTVLVTALLLLVGCQQQAPAHNYQYYMLHPEAIKATYQRCTSLAPDAAMQDKQCVAAAKAQRDLSLQVMEAQANGLAYGLKILQVQMALGDTQQQLQAIAQQLKASKENSQQLTNLQAQQQQLTDKLQQLQQQYQQMLVVVSVVGG